MSTAKEQSLIAHLLELRDRLLRSVYAVTAVFLGLLPFANNLYTWLAEPLQKTLPKGGQLVATEVASTFLVPMKLAFFMALFIAMPVVLYQLWAFIAPALYEKEKRLARPMLIASGLLFYAGCAFMFYVLLPLMFAYLNSSAPSGVMIMTDISKYLDFVLILLLAGGLSFEVPIVVLIAVLLGFVKVAQLVEWRGYMIIVIFIISAALTPNDGLSMIIMALPMCLLYELGILVARAMQKAKLQTRFSE